MTAASWSESWTWFTAAARLLREAFKFGGVNSLNFDGLQETLQEAIRGDGTAQAQEKLGALRQKMADLCAGHRDLLEDALVAAARSVGFVSGGFSDMIEHLAEYMHDESEPLVSRNFTRGALSSDAGSPGLGISGAGVIFCNVDKRGYQIEDGLPTKVYLKIVGDQGTQAVSGVAAVRAYCSGEIKDGVVSSTAVPTVDGYTAAVGGNGNDGNLLKNGAMKAVTATHPFAPWLNSSANYTSITAHTTSGARADIGSANQANQSGLRTACKIAASGSAGALYQLVKHEYSRDVPYTFFAWWRGEGGWNRQVRFRHGTHEIVISAAGGAWNVAYASGGTGLWYDNFRASPMKFEIYVTCPVTGAGHVLIDNVWLGQMDYYNGRYFKVRTGRSDYAVGRYWTYTDDEANSFGNQAMLNKIVRVAPNVRGAYLPHVLASVASIADPAA